MATSHNCTKNCGCTDTYVVTQPCPPSCPEVFNSQCIVYTGTNIVCGNTAVINRYDYMDTVITKLVNYICSGLANVPISTVVSDSDYIDVTSTTVGNTTQYGIGLDFTQLAADLNLTLPVYNVVGSDNVFVSTTVVGNTTTYTLSGFETEVINSDGLLNVTPNITPGVDIIYTVNVNLAALAAALPSTSVIQGPSGNTLITTSVVGNLTTYSIDSLETIVAAGNNTTVTPSGGGAPNYDTTYTVDSEAATLALAGGETLLTLTSTYDAPNNMTNYELAHDSVVLDQLINTEINDVLDNTTTGPELGATYDNLTQTLNITFNGVTTGGGLTGNGTASSPLVATGTQKFTSLFNNIPPLGTVVINHNLNTTSLVVSAINLVLPAPYVVYTQGVDYTYVINSNNQITVTDISGAGLPNFVLTAIG